MLWLEVETNMPHLISQGICVGQPFAGVNLCHIFQQQIVRSDQFVFSFLESLARSVEELSELQCFDVLTVVQRVYLHWVTKRQIATNMCDKREQKQEKFHHNYKSSNVFWTGTLGSRVVGAVGFCRASRWEQVHLSGVGNWWNFNASCFLLTSQRSLHCVCASVRSLRSKLPRFVRDASTLVTSPRRGRLS